MAQPFFAGGDDFHSRMLALKLVSCKLHTAATCSFDYEQGDSDGTYIRTAGAVDTNIDGNIAVCIMRNFREEDGVRGYIQLARFASLELAWTMCLNPLQTWVVGQHRKGCAEYNAKSSKVALHSP